MAASDLDNMALGPDYINPKPEDKRLHTRIEPAVARAAVDSGVARLPYPRNYLEDEPKQAISG